MEQTPPGEGFAIAYAFVNRRERTVAEVRSRLERAELGAEEIDEVIAELLGFGYLDDARYARVFTQDKRALASWGNERIARALGERGVERDLIQAALAEDAGQDGWGAWDGLAAGSGAGGDFAVGDGYGDDTEASGEFARALALLYQRFPSGPGVQRDRERAFGVLARKGYESETAADAVREWVRRTAV